MKGIKRKGIWIIQGRLYCFDCGTRLKRLSVIRSSNGKDRHICDNCLSNYNIYPSFKLGKEHQAKGYITLQGSVDDLT